MSQDDHCPRCFAPLRRATSPEGLCPKCLIAVAMGGDGKIRTAQGEPVAPPPSIDELAPHFPELDILSLVGRGGAGAVYRAVQRDLGRVIALKVLLLDPERDPSFGERFVREARAMASLSHPNIASVHDAGRAGPYWYLSMEFVDGPNLRQVLAGGALAASEALDITRGICAALEYAHGRGVVHRDIKPENVLVAEAGQVKLVDFGLAKIVGERGAHETLTRTSQAMGTWRYMAPEQLNRPLEVDHRADIYSLGVVLYELLTGEVPQGRYRSLSERTGADARLDGIVDRTLEQDPERRYQAVSGVGHDLDEMRSRPASPVPARRSRPERRRTPQRSGWAWGCLLLAMVPLLMLGTCLVAYTGSSVNMMPLAPEPEGMPGELPRLLNGIAGPYNRRPEVRDAAAKALAQLLRVERSLAIVGGMATPVDRWIQIQIPALSDAVRDAEQLVISRIALGGAEGGETMDDVVQAVERAFKPYDEARLFELRGWPETPVLRGVGVDDIPGREAVLSTIPDHVLRRIGDSLRFSEFNFTAEEAGFQGPKSFGEWQRAARVRER